MIGGKTSPPFSSGPIRLDLFSNFKRVRRGKGRRGDDPRPSASSRFADRFLSLPRARALGAERARFRWAVSGKQNRRWGMNRKSDQGSRRGPTYAESRDDPGRGEEGEGVPPLSLPSPSRVVADGNASGAVARGRSSGEDPSSSRPSPVARPSPFPATFKPPKKGVVP